MNKYILYNRIIGGTYEVEANSKIDALIILYYKLSKKEPLIMEHFNFSIKKDDNANNRNL
jgi:hypothetical protein